MANLYAFNQRGPWGYNVACAAVPKDEDLVVLMDNVLMVGDWSDHLLDCVKQYSMFDVYVCMATRATGPQQLPDNIQNVQDILVLHAAMAALAIQNRGQVVAWKSEQQPLDFFVCLRKRFWKSYPFPSTKLTSDGWFKYIRRVGPAKVGLLIGIGAIRVEE